MQSIVQFFHVFGIYQMLLEYLISSAMSVSAS